MKSDNFSKNALLFILVTICIDSIGLGIIIPSFPRLIAETAHVSLKHSSAYFGWVMGAYAFMQFLFSPMIGSLSDRFGRRPILLVSVFGMGLDYLFMFFAPDLFWLILGRSVAGIFGASYTSAAAYIADISTPENRAKNFGMIGAAFGIGFVLGPGIGGLLADFGTRAPFLVAAIFSLLNFIFGFFVLKESLPVSDRRAFDWRRSNPLGAFKQLQRFKKAKYLFVVVFLVLLANMSVHTVWNYYTMEKFGWTEKYVGISLAVVGVCFGLVQGGLSGWIVSKLGEKGTATLGLVTLVLVTMGIGLIPSGWMMYLMILPYALSGIVDPAIRSIVSGQTENNEQGELQGVFTSLMSLAEIIGPPLMMYIYSTSKMVWEKSSFAYGTPFFAGAFFSLIAFFVLRRALKNKSEPTTPNSSDQHLSLQKSIDEMEKNHEV
jgi:DHA1 family tetracycline resistance protein-like MFS transporter